MTYQDFLAIYCGFLREHSWMEDPELMGPVYVLPLHREPKEKSEAWRTRLIEENYIADADPEDLEVCYLCCVGPEAGDIYTATAAYSPSTETVIDFWDDVDVDPEALDWDTVMATVFWAVDSNRPHSFAEAMTQSIELYAKWDGAGQPMIFNDSREEWRQ